MKINFINYHAQPGKSTCSGKTSRRIMRTNRHIVLMIEITMRRDHNLQEFDVVIVHGALIKAKIISSGQNYFFQSQKLRGSSNQS